MFISSPVGSCCVFGGKMMRIVISSDTQKLCNKNKRQKQEPTNAVKYCLQNCVEMKTCDVFSFTSKQFLQERDASRVPHRQLPTALRTTPRICETSQRQSDLVVHKLWLYILMQLLVGCSDDLSRHVIVSPGSGSWKTGGIQRVIRVLYQWVLCHCCGRCSSSTGRTIFAEGFRVTGVLSTFRAIQATEVDHGLWPAKDREARLEIKKLDDFTQTSTTSWVISFTRQIYSQCGQFNRAGFRDNNDNDQHQAWQQNASQGWVISAK